MDTGAGHSCVHPRVLNALKMKCEPPVGPIKEVGLGDVSLKTPRLGRIKLDVRALFLFDDKAPLQCAHEFEVMNIGTDFIAGSDLDQFWFPTEHNQMSRFMISPDALASIPERLWADFDVDDQGLPLLPSFRGTDTDCAAAHLNVQAVSDALA